MKLAALSLGLVGLASANIHLDLGLNLGHHTHRIGGNKVVQNPHEWIAAGSNDARSPCPMLNTLANHNYIHHDGRNITREDLAHGFMQSINFDEALAMSMFDIVLQGNPGATDFDLDSLNKHNAGEHDASLSRLDAYFGNNHLFNPSVFAQTRQYWTDKTLTAQMLANSKLARQVHSKAFNPTYTYPESTEETSYTETGFPILAFGDIEKGTVDRDAVVYWFTNERLPTEVGWKARETATTADQMAAVSKMIQDAVSLITGKQ
ncbi:Chloroperoxidase [Aspergillus unguis]